MLPGWDKRKLGRLAKGNAFHEAAIQAAKNEGVTELAQLSNYLDQLAKYDWFSQEEEEEKAE